MSGDRTPARWLIVVRRDKHDLYVNLRESFASEGQVAVILDHRQPDLRGEGGSPETGQPRQERRRTPTPAERALWEEAGFLLIYRGDDLKVYEAESKPSKKEVPRPGPERGVG